LSISFQIFQQHFEVTVQRQMMHFCFFWPVKIFW